MVSAAKKKLLVLDVNGLLLDTYFKNDKRPYCRADGKVNKHHVYRRPYCNEFIEFCFVNFEVGIWSSAKKHNVEGFINFIFGDLKSKLLFTWHQSDCTDTGLRTPGNRYKPVFLKELSKLWNKVKPDLPWEKGDFGPSNTLLIDDSPYKALRNPPYTAVFPDPYKVSNNGDDSLGGALRKYLEGLATASDVQYYVKHHPFGQPPIGKESPHWNFYSKILLPVEDSAPYMEEENDMVNAAIPNLEKSVPSENIEDGLRNGNVQHSELSSYIGEREKKRKNHPVSRINQSLVPGGEEDNGVVTVAMLNMEKCKSAETKKGNLQSGNGPQSESSSRSGKHKKRHNNYLGTSTNQSSVPSMEEDNSVVNMEMLNTEKTISSENIRDNLQSGNGLQSEASSQSGKRKKRRKDRSSVPSMEEDKSVVNMAMVNTEKSISSENIRDNLQSGKGLQSEVSSQNGKRKKRCKDRSSVPSMEEDNSVVNIAMLNTEKSISLENIRDNLQTGNGLQSEVSSRSGKQKKRRKDRSSVPSMEEDNSVINMAMLNTEKSISSENIRDNLQSGNGLQSEVSLRSGKRKKRGKDRSSVPSMEEDNSVVNMAVLNTEKSLSSEYRRDNLQSGNGLESEVSLRSRKRKKKSKDRSSVPSMEEDNSVVHMVTLNTEKSISSENIRDNLQSGNGLQSEVSLRSGKRKKRFKDRFSVPSIEEDNSVVNMGMLNTENIRDNLQSGNGLQSEVSLLSGKRKKRHRDCVSTSINQSSVPSMEEENGVVNMAMLNMEMSISLENRKVNLQSGNRQQSEVSSRSSKRKRRQRDCPLTGTSESSFLGKQKVENGVAEMGMPDVGKSRSITQDLLSQEHESWRMYRGYKNVNLLSEHGKPSETGLSQDSSFSNHKRKHKRIQNANVSRGSAPAVEYREDGLAKAINMSTRKGYGTTVASFLQEAVAEETDKEHCGNKSDTKFRDHNGFRDERKVHHYKPVHFSPNPHMNSNRWSSSYCKRDS